MKNPLQKILGIALFLISFGQGIAQTINLEQSPSSKTQISFDFSSAIFNNSAISRSIYSGLYSLNINTPVSSKFNIIGEIPIIVSDFDFKKFHYGDINGTKFGNISIGMQTNPVISEGRRTILTLKLFLPTAEDKYGFVGSYDNFYNLQLSTIKSTGFYFNVMHEKLNDQGFNYSVEAGPNITIPTGDNNGETELFLHFGGSLGYQVNKLLINAEFKGICIVSEDVNDFSDRFYNMASIGLQWKEETFTPKIFFSKYIKEFLNDSIDGVWGVGFSYRF